MNEELFEAFEDAASVQVGGLNLFLFGLCCAVGALLAILLFGVLCRKVKLSGNTALVWGALVLPIGLVLSRLVFCALDFGFHAVFSPRAVISFWGGGFSMTGAILGAALAAVITAKLQKIQKLTLLDIAAIAFFAFIACERLGEGFTEILGRSRSLAEDVFKVSFFSDTDGETWKLRTYQFEYITAMVLLVVTTLFYRSNHGRPGDTLMLAVLLYGATQVFWESLRFDSHLRRSFVDMQQVLAAVMMAVPAMIHTVRYSRTVNKNTAVYVMIGLLLLNVGGIIGIEFMIDRTGISRVLLYAVYALLLSLPVAAALICRKRSLAAK